jgi:hypothetical protein
MILLGIILVAIAAIAEAIMDTLSHRFNNSIFSELDRFWWDPTFSWRNKYRQRNITLGPRFWGSTTFFVFTTDAWHMFKMISKEGSLLGIALILVGVLDVNFWHVAILFTLNRLFFGIVFHINYTYLFKRL